MSLHLKSKHYQAYEVDGEQDRNGAVVAREK